MKKVTSCAAIIAVPTLITGYYGMNVPYPGVGRHWGRVDVKRAHRRALACDLSLTSDSHPLSEAGRAVGEAVVLHAT